MENLTEVRALEGRVATDREPAALPGPVPRERRAWPRVPCCVGAVGAAGGEASALYLVDVSRGGGFALTDGNFAPGALMRIEVPEVSRMTFEARVVDRFPRGVRFRFLRVPVDLRHVVPRNPDFQRYLAENPDYGSQIPWLMALAHPLYLLAKSYFRLEVTGTEHIPYGSRFLWTHNHSGWLPLDAVLVGYLVSRHNHVERFPDPGTARGLLETLLHPQPIPMGDWGVTFWNSAVMCWPGVRDLLRAMHGVPAADLRHPERLGGYRVLGTPAEGEEGNCKSSFTERYRLQAFRTGVARAALETGMDYVQPAAIVGPEESFPNLAKMRWPKGLVGTVLPLPLPVVPLPVQWKVQFLPPLDIRRYQRAWRAAADEDERYLVCQGVMTTLRRQVERALARMLDGRRPFRPWFVA